MEFTTVQTTAALLAMLVSLGLGMAILRQRPLRPYHVAFSLGMLAFAAEGLAAWRLLQPQDGSVGNAIIWVRMLGAASLGICLTWLLFLGLFWEEESGRPRSPRWWIGLSALCLVAIPGGAGLTYFARAAVVQVGSTFRLLAFDTVARSIVVVELLATVVILVGLELSLRLSKSRDRWRVKYLVLGLGSIFLVRFYVLTGLLLFNALTPAYVATTAATLFVGNLAVAFALRRGVRAVGLALSRHVVFRSTIVGLLGTYLLSVGALGWILVRLDIPQIMFWGSLIVFVAGIVLAALLLSENLRWRIKRFIGMHFYRSKYDYRGQWRSFTARLSSAVSPKECGPQFLQAVTEAVGATEGALYLAAAADGQYRCAASVGYRIPVSTISAEAALVQRLRGERRALALDPPSGRLDTPGDPELDRYVAEVALIVPLVWQDSLTGLMFLGAERTGVEYGAEDLEFLTTVGEQVAGVLATAQLAEQVAQTREFEAFHRLTSFVIHDIKNSVSSLSLLSRNALQNFDDPEFQRDAMRTISAVVNRMTSLLGKLEAPARSETVELEPVDLKAVADDVVRVVRQATAVRLLKDAERVMVRGDVDSLRRVLENLVTNAVQAVNGEGHGGRVTVKTYRDGDWAVMEVADTGVGMSDEYLRESLFVPFRSTKPGGWGVGLYQAREIVRRHGGSIAVTSRQGGGTTFWVRLPLVPRPLDIEVIAKDHMVGTGGR